jgi:hypothetical protein
MTLTRWLLVSIPQKNLIRPANTTEDKKAAQELNRLIVDTLVLVGPFVEEELVDSLLLLGTGIRTDFLQSRR